MDAKYGASAISDMADPANWEIWPAPEHHPEVLYQHAERPFLFLLRPKPIGPSLFLPGGAFCAAASRTPLAPERNNHE